VGRVDKAKEVERVASKKKMPQKIEEPHNGKRDSGQPAKKLFLNGEL